MADAIPDRLWLVRNIKIGDTFVVGAIRITLTQIKVDHNGYRVAKLSLNAPSNIPITRPNMVSRLVRLVLDRQVRETNLILSRYKNERINAGDVTIEVREVGCSVVKLAVLVPSDIATRHEKAARPHD